MQKLAVIFLLVISLTEQPQSQVQTTLCRNRLNLTIFEFSTVRDSILFVSNTSCIVTDVNFKVDTLLHPWVNDIRVYFRKGNVGVLAINWVGGSGDNFIHTVLDDSAALSIHQGSAPFTGTYRPSNPLTPFNGQQAAGYWKIAAGDTGASGDTGMLKAWCVIVSYQNCTGGIETVEIPNNYILEQNYPNPFNPATKLKYGLPENSFVKLAVYDISGREMRVLVNESRLLILTRLILTAQTCQVVYIFISLKPGIFF